MGIHWQAFKKLFLEKHNVILYNNPVIVVTPSGRSFISFAAKAFTLEKKHL